MTDLVTVTGFVGSDPRHNVTDAGLPITNFRLATSRRYFDRAKGEWVDGETNWYSVSAFRQLAVNAAASVSKGDRVVVHGRLRIRPWETGEKSGTAVEIDAEAMGHDLSWGRTKLTRTAASRSVDDGERPGAAAVSEADPSSPAGEDAWARPGSSAGWPAASVDGDSDDEAGDRFASAEAPAGDDEPAAEGITVRA